MPLRDETRAALTKAGWREDQDHGTNLLAETLRGRGFTFHDAARAFLARYGGVRVNRAPIVPHPTTLMFHTDAEAVVTHPSWIADWEAAAGSHVCPIGETGYGSYILIMDERGRVIGADQQDQLTFWADSGEELLDLVLGSGGGPTPLLPEDCLPLDKP